MTFSGNIGPSFDSYGHLHVKNYQNHFYHAYQHPMWPKMDKNWVYFGPFRAKIDPNMVSYNITFTKKRFFMPTFHLFTQIRIILDHHGWDHFSTKRNLNKQIWVISLSALPLALEYSVPRCGISIKDVVQKPSMIGLKWGNCWRNTILWYTFIDLKVNETLGTL